MSSVRYHPDTNGGSELLELLELLELELVELLLLELELLELELFELELLELELAASSSPQLSPQPAAGVLAKGLRYP